MRGKNAAAAALRIPGEPKVRGKKLGVLSLSVRGISCQKRIERNSTGVSSARYEMVPERHAPSP